MTKSLKGSKHVIFVSKIIQFGAFFSCSRARERARKKKWFKSYSMAQLISRLLLLISQTCSLSIWFLLLSIQIIESTFLLHITYVSVYWSFALPFNKIKSPRLKKCFSLKTISKLEWIAKKKIENSSRGASIVYITSQKKALNF